MNNISHHRAYIFVAVLFLSNVYWLWLGLTSEQAATAKTAQVLKQPAVADVKQVDITPAPKLAESQPEKPSATAPAKTASPIAATEKKQNSEKNEPRLIGKVNIDYFTLERMVRQLGGGIFLYDINQRKPVRQINQGVLISAIQPTRPLSVVSHNITSELEKDMVENWIYEQRQLIPNGQFVVVAKLPIDYQTGFEQFVKTQAQQRNTEFNKIDEVRFNFTAQGLHLREFFTNGKIIVINQPYSS